MGLDVSAYGGLVKVESPNLDSDGSPQNYDTERRFYRNDDYPTRFEGLDENAVYTYEVEEDVFSGAYSRYNGWREALAKLAGYPALVSQDQDRYRGHGQPRHDEGAWAASSGPFWELISFSDCEGGIGPVVAAKLAKDFAAFQEQADAHESEYFRTTYAAWRKGCEIASNCGALDFH